MASPCSRRTTLLVISYTWLTGVMSGPSWLQASSESIRVNWLMSTWHVSEAQQWPRANTCLMRLATSRMRSKSHSHTCNRLPHETADTRVKLNGMEKDYHVIRRLRQMC